MAYSYAGQPGTPQVTVGSTVSPGGVISFANWGVSIITESSADIRVLAPPVAGCQKTLVWQTSSSVANVVKLSTNAAQTVSVLGTPNTTYTVIKKSAAASTNAVTVVQLVGLNTTAWLMVNVFPSAVTTPTAANFGGGAITLSTS